MFNIIYRTYLEFLVNWSAEDSHKYLASWIKTYTPLYTIFKNKYFLSLPIYYIERFK
jgi:hypothetical protein